MLFRTLFLSDLIEEYLIKVYKEFSLTQPGILCTYYNVNVEESVYDNNNQATYGIPGSNDLTGIKYNQISNIMLQFGTRAQRQDSISQNYGYNNYDTNFTVYLSSVFKIEPQPYDYIIFTPNPQQETKTFIVQSIERATLGVQSEHLGYNLTLKPYYIENTQLEESTVNRFAFDPMINDLVDPDTYNQHVLLVYLIDKLSRKISSYYNPAIGGLYDINKQIDLRIFNNVLSKLRNYSHTYLRDTIPFYTSSTNEDFYNIWLEYIEQYNDNVISDYFPYINQYSIIDSVKNANTVNDIYVIVNDQSIDLNFIEVMILLTKLILLLEAI